MKMKGAAALAALCLMGMSPVLAAETPAAAPPAGGKLLLELNNAQTAAATCQVTFVIQNKTSTEIQTSSYIMSVFDTAGQIIKPINLKFPPFPAGKIKVIQFTLDLTCDKMGSIVPEVTECKAADGSDSTICDDATTSSKTTIRFSSDIQ